MTTHHSVQIIFSSCYLNQVPHLPDNSISEIRGLEKCRSLTYLSMEHNKILRISGFKNLPLIQLSLVMSVLLTGPWYEFKAPRLCMAVIGVSMGKKNIQKIGHSNFYLEMCSQLVSDMVEFFNTSSTVICTFTKIKTRSFILANKSVKCRIIII